jgi:hypothetical protein
MLGAAAMHVKRPRPGCGAEADASPPQLDALPGDIASARGGVLGPIDWPRGRHRVAPAAYRRPRHELQDRHPEAGGMRRSIWSCAYPLTDASAFACHEHSKRAYNECCNARIYSGPLTTEGALQAATRTGSRVRVPSLCFSLLPRFSLSASDFVAVACCGVRGMAGLLRLACAREQQCDDGRGGQRGAGGRK